MAKMDLLNIMIYFNIIKKYHRYFKNNNQIYNILYSHA